MALVELKRDPSPREVRQFAVYLLPGFCLFLAALSAYRWESKTAAAVFVVGAVLSVLLYFTQPKWMRILLIGWMAAAFPMGWLVSHVLMGIIYFLVVTPIGLIMRALGRDPLSRSFDAQAESYWTPRETARDASSYFKQY